MLPTLSICADCERQALRTPRRGSALVQALAGLADLLLQRKRLEGLQVVRESCRRHCSLGRVSVTLNLGGREAFHALAPEEDVRIVAAQLAGTRRS